MRLAFILTCYEDTPQLARLVERLEPLAACFAVHCDRRAGAAVLRAVRERLARFPNVFFLESKRCRWGDAGLVDAQVRGVRAIVERGVSFDFVTALSGSDYPIKPLAQIESFLAARPGKSFMTHTPIPSDDLAFLGDRGLDRIQYWYFRKPGRTRLAPNDILAFPKPGCFGRQPMAGVWDTAVRLWPFGKRAFFEELQPWYGGCFWTLSRTAADYLADFTTRRPDVLKGARTLLLPDELIVQSILMSSPLAGEIVNDDYRYVIWEKRETGGPPAFLDERDWDNLRQSDRWIARKFDERRTPGILDRVDEMGIG